MTDKQWRREKIHLKIDDFFDRRIRSIIISIFCIINILFISMIYFEIPINDTFDAYINVFAITAALMAAYYGAIINRKNKTADITSGCNARYDMIAQDRLLITDDDSAIQYYRRYWGLKSDQLDYWMYGLVDPESIFSWFYQVLDSFYRDLPGKSTPYEISKAGKMGFAAGWDSVKGLHKSLNPRLYDMVNEIKMLAEQDIEKGTERSLKLIEILRQSELKENSYIAFSDVTLFGIKILRKNMSAYKRMEDRRRRIIDEERSQAVL